MPSPKAQEDKLLPLRKFAVPGVYSAAYLSQLVQRKKLKATKIGRNFFTCERWFNEYLEKHAQDAKQKEYFAYKQSINQPKPEKNAKITNLNLNNQRTPVLIVPAEQLEKTINKKIIWTALSTVLAAVFILTNIYFLMSRDSQGRIAGEEEKLEQQISKPNISTSTKLDINSKY